MISTKDVKYNVSQKTEDARDLQLRLYREIGISAVAAALSISGERRDPIVPSLVDTPVVPCRNELAA